MAPIIPVNQDPEMAPIIPVNPVAPPQNDPSNKDPFNGINQALKELEKYEAILERDKGELQKDIAAMMALILQAAHNPMKAFQALQMAQTTVLPEVNQVQGDKMLEQSGQLDLGTGLRDVFQAFQGTFNHSAGNANDPSKNPMGDAKQFAEDLHKLWKDYLNSGTKCPSYLDPMTYASICTSLNSLASGFGSSLDDPNFVEDMTVNYYNKINEWFTDNGGPPKPHEALTEVQGAFTQLNNTVSSMSQIRQMQMQAAASNFNQIVNALKGMLDAQKQYLQALVSSQKAS